MWLKSVILISLAFVDHYAQPSVIQNDNTNSIIWNRLQDIIQRKCLKNASQSKYEEVLNELTNLKNHHWHSLIVEEPTFEEHSRVHCHSRKPEILGYLERFAEKFESCTENDEKYLQQFILRAYEKYSQYFCSQIKPLIADLPGTTVKCIAKFLENPGINPHSVCSRKSKIFGSTPRIEVITKRELCEDLVSIRSCYAASFSTYCNDALLLRSFQLGIIEEALTDCQDVWYTMLKKYLKMQL